MLAGSRTKGHVLGHVSLGAALVHCRVGFLAVGHTSPSRVTALSGWTCGVYSNYKSVRGGWGGGGMIVESSRGGGGGQGCGRR